MISAVNGKRITPSTAMRDIHPMNRAVVRITTQISTALPSSVYNRQQEVFLANEKRIQAAEFDVDVSEIFTFVEDIITVGSTRIIYYRFFKKNDPLFNIDKAIERSIQDTLFEKLKKDEYFDMLIRIIPKKIPDILNVSYNRDNMTLSGKEIGEMYLDEKSNTIQEVLSKCNLMLFDVLGSNPNLIVKKLRLKGRFQASYNRKTKTLSCERTGNVVNKKDQSITDFLRMHNLSVDDVEGNSVDLAVKRQVKNNFIQARYINKSDTLVGFGIGQMRKPDNLSIPEFIKRSGFDIIEINGEPI